jgi:EmrB/QacA subfamily drug resistance transporter
MPLTSKKNGALCWQVRHDLNSALKDNLSHRTPISISKPLLLFTSSFTLFCTSYLFSALNIALPAINAEFKVDAILLSWLSTAIIIGSAVLLIPFGRLADIVGIRKMIISGMVLSTAASISAYFSVSINMLIISRALQGISSAMVVGNIMALVSAVFPPGERGRALGFTSSSVYVGITISPLLSGVLTEHFGWRSIFLVSIFSGLIIILFFFWKIRGEWQGAKGEPLDITGSVLFVISILSFMYGFSHIGSNFPTWQMVGFIGAGIFLFFIFLRWESKNRYPVLNLALFKKNRVFVMSNISAFLNYTSIFPVSFLLSLYLQIIKGLNAEQASFIIVVQPFVQALISPFAGRLSDKIEPRIVASIGMAVSCFGLFLFSFITIDTSFQTIIITFIILGIGFALFVAPNTNAAMCSVEPKVYGLASALISTMRNMGQLFSMVILTVFLSILMGRVMVTPENFPAFINSCKILFSVFEVLSFLGIFTSLARGKVR